MATLAQRMRMFVLFAMILVASARIHGRRRFSKPSFDRLNRHNFRGIVGNYVELPCVVHNARASTVSWVRRGEVLSTDDSLTTRDSRFTLRKDSYSDTWMLILEPSRYSDAGTYECVVTLPNGEEMSKIFYLHILENRDTIRWRSDSRCGSNELLRGNESDVPVVCDAYGAYPCCSTFGWCGFSDQHCKCHGCIDYRDGSQVQLIEQEEVASSSETHAEIEMEPQCGIPFDRLQGTDKCIAIAGSRMSWHDARGLCDSIGANLLTYESYNSMTQEQFNMIRQAEPNAKVWVHLTPPQNNVLANFWSYLMGHQQPEETVIEECMALSHFAHNITSHHEDCDSLNHPLCYKSISA